VVDCAGDDFAALKRARWHAHCTSPRVETSRDWIEKGARFGHFTKGILYGLMGALALQVALGNGGQVAGSREAARLIERQPLGAVLLLLMAVGFAAYAVWRCLVAIQDSEHKGRDLKGFTQRAGALVGGLANAALAIALFQMALGRSGGRNDAARSWVGELLAQPFGAVVVAVVGVGIVIAALVQFHRAYTKKFLGDFRWRSMSRDERRWVTRLGQAGYGAQAVVFSIIGAGLVRAALEKDPGQTRGVREALLDIAHSSAGQILLGVVALGFLAFGSFLIASARYRHIAC
jgi:hypothetical protein